MTEIDNQCEVFDPKLPLRPLIQIVGSMDDVEHPWIVFPDPCGPMRVMINEKLYREHLELLEDYND